LPWTLSFANADPEVFAQAAAMTRRRLEENLKNG
jgi:hypothetical protein